MNQPADNASGLGKALFVIWRIFRLLAAGYLVVLLLVYVLQRRLQYFPDASDVSLPTGESDTGIEEFSVTAEDGVRLKGWYWPQPVASAPVLLILHGNGGNRADRLEWLEMLRSLECGICIIDYRGYGGSGGRPTEKGLYRDAEAAYNWITERTDAPLVYFGESLGTAVAVELARRHPPAALILQSGFSSAVDVGQEAYPLLPVRFFLKDTYNSIGKISQLRAPLLVIHGTRDRIVPIHFARKLYEVAPQPKQWLEIPQAGHNDLPWVQPRDYLAALENFLKSCLLL